MRTKENLQLLKSAFVVPIVVALIAILPIDSFSFYMLVRWVMFASFLASFIAIDEENGLFVFIVSAIGAIRFNPFDITVQDKFAWVIADMISAAYFYFLITSLERQIKGIDDERKYQASDRAKEIEEARKKHLAEAKANNQRIIEERKQLKVSPEQLKEWAKDSSKFTNPSLFTTEEIASNRQAMSRRDGIAIIVGLIVLGLMVGGFYLAVVGIQTVVASNAFKTLETIIAGAFLAVIALGILFAIGVATVQSIKEAIRNPRKAMKVIFWSKVTPVIVTILGFIAFIIVFERWISS